MTASELSALKETMPWTEQIITTRTGGLVRILNNRGEEVPMFTIIEFVKAVTHKMASNREAATT